MSLRLNKETTLCVSLSARPSNIGTRFHNYLYEALELNYVYKAFAPSSLEDAVRGIRGLGIRGAAISMPYKEDVIALVDELDFTAAAIESVNTIVNSDGHLKAYNTDFSAVRDVVAASSVRRETAVVYGSGGMAKACVAALAEIGFLNIYVVARNEIRGRALAEKYGGRYVVEFSDPCDVVINATPVGMAGGSTGEQLAVPLQVIAHAGLVVDVVAVPADTPVIRAAQQQNIPVIRGTEIMAAQAVEQFVLYTGVRPSSDLVAAATLFSRTN